MNCKSYIGLLILSMCFFAEVTQAQDLPTACGNSKIRYRMHGQPGSSFAWTVRGGDIIKIYALGDSIDINWDNLAGTHSLTCQEYVANGCAGPPVVKKVNIETLSLNLADSTYFCKGETITLDAGNNFTSYLWNTGSSSSSIRINLPGVYRVEAVIGKCHIRDSVKVIGLLPPDVNLGKDTMLKSPDKILLDAQNPGSYYYWNDNSHNQTRWAREGDGTIWVVVTSRENCAASDTINIKPFSTPELKIPNVFTPNGDGTNDVWRIGGLQDYSKTNVKIFDRWGRMIFDSEPGYPKPWNGEHKGKLLPMDTYYYVIDLKNGDEPIRGSVTIIP